ncbi:MAG: 4-hydroxy-tetrahydrodipicolinate synthase [Firmicutes bacterium]|jgi:4-hydroxy-tetrahydrodipicolinate synthase|nr:4-hydroxy-tetrahydrodipicolinate synthase [Bacillota bacterium]
MFGRLLTAMVTPFDDDLNVDYGRAEELAARLVDSGSDGIVVGGTTGESPTLRTEEKVELARVVAAAVGKRVPVLAGTGSNSTEASIELTRKIRETGVSGVMLVTPYYNKPSQEGLYRHFKSVAEATDLPVMMYNVPGRTSVNMTAATVLRLLETKNIVALKEASGSLDQVGEIVSRAPDSFAVYSGDDSLTLPMMAVGAVGVVSVASHVAGREMKRMIEAFAVGDTAEAKRIHLRLLPLFKTLFITTNPVPVKAALAMVGFGVGGVRQPLWAMEPREEQAVRSCLESLGLA